jgi:DNA-binding NarL/FixJ family response regulator
MSTRIRVLIVDDQVLFAETLGFVLGRISSEIVVVGIASDGEEALSLATSRPVDLILMDVRMPRMDGVQATMRIHESRPDIKIVMLTTFDDDVYVHSAIKHGAVGYLLKSIRPQDLVVSIRAVMAGATLFSREVSERFGSEPGKPEAGGLERIIGGLSSRESEVLGLAMEMFSNKQIADRLHLSEQGIRNYMSGLYGTFGVRGRLELMQTLNAIWPRASSEQGTADLGR